MISPVFGKIFKASLLTTAAFLVLSHTLTCEAAKKKEEIDPEKAKMQAIEKKREMIEASKKELSRTAWQIEIIPVGGETDKEKKYTDTLRFINDKIESEKLVKEGFAPSNFSVRLKELKAKPGKNLIIWETMQISSNKGISYWRGEMEDTESIMRGALSRHFDEKNIKNYTFVSVLKEVIPVQVKAPKEPESIQEAVPVKEAQPVQETTTAVAEKKAPVKAKAPAKKAEPVKETAPAKEAAPAKETTAVAEKKAPAKAKAPAKKAEPVKGTTPAKEAAPAKEAQPAKETTAVKIEPAVKEEELKESATFTAEEKPTETKTQEIKKEEAKQAKPAAETKPAAKKK